MNQISPKSLAFVCLFLIAKQSFSAVPLIPTIKSTSPLRKDLIKELKGIPGTFASPEAEIAKNNMKGAQLSCLQNAQVMGTLRNGLNPTLALEFASQKSQVIDFRNILKNQKRLELAAKLTGQHKMSSPILQLDSCRADYRYQICGELLARATTEIAQAEFNSELKKNNDLWMEVLSFLGFNKFVDAEGLDIRDYLKARLAETTEDPKDKNRSAYDFDLTVEDPLIIATSLIMQKLDHALARGDEKSIADARSLLKKVNPSAEYAVACTLSYLPFGGKNTDLDGNGKPRAKQIGPLSGIDYGKNDELKIRGTGVEIAAIIVGGVIAGAGIFVASNDAKKDQEIANKANEIAARDTVANLTIAQETCKANCDDIKDQLQEAKLMLESFNPKNTNDKSTKEALKEESRAPFSPFVEGVDDTGGSGGHRVENEIELERGPRTVKKFDWNKHVDSDFAAKYCEKTVQEFQRFSSRVKSGPARSNDLVLDNRVQPAFTNGGYGVADFRKWDTKFWNEQRSVFLNNPKNISKINSCNSLDRIDVAN